MSLEGYTLEVRWDKDYCLHCKCLITDCKDDCPTLKALAEMFESESGPVA
jgi:hypothetical protein